MRGKKINPQALIEILCYLIFSFIIIYFVISNKYLSYVTPRMKPYLIFTSVVMAIWAFRGFRRLYIPQHILRTAHCYVLLLPILLLLIPHKTIGVSDLKTGYVNRSNINNAITTRPDYNSNNGLNDLSKNVIGEQNTIKEQNTIENKNIIDEPNTIIDQNKIKDQNIVVGQNTVEDQNTIVDQNNLKEMNNVRNLSGLDADNKKIVISDEEFYQWLTEIFTNMNQYVGYRVAIKGFVFKDDPELKDNEFLASRFMMSCCTADLVPCGIVCQYEQLSALKADTWITVEGIIHIGEYLGEDEPQITVTSISEAKKPKEEYIYPY